MVASAACLFKEDLPVDKDERLLLGLALFIIVMTLILLLAGLAHDDKLIPIIEALKR